VTGAPVCTNRSTIDTVRSPTGAQTAAIVDNEGGGSIPTHSLGGGALLPGLVAGLTSWGVS
jgi:hypothetical protein